MREQAIERIKEFLIDESNDCILGRPINQEGYVEIQLWDKNKNKYHFLGHRLSYEIANNVKLTISDIIRHRCDNRKCINPKHLIIGTHEDNVNDRVERNRSAKGEANGRSKLTKEQVIEIRTNVYMIGLSNAQIARDFKVNRKTIRLIRQNKTWSDLS